NLGIGYANSTLVFNRHADWQSQRLRLPSETLANKVANCLDGAVLVASLLEAFGLRTALVFTGSGDKGHAFVGWETSPNTDNWSPVETNAFMTKTFAEARQSADALAAAFEAEAKSAVGAAIFCRLPIRKLRAMGVDELE